MGNLQRCAVLVDCQSLQHISEGTIGYRYFNVRIKLRQYAPELKIRTLIHHLLIAVQLSEVKHTFINVYQVIYDLFNGWKYPSGPEFDGTQVQGHLKYHRSFFRHHPIPH